MILTTGRSVPLFKTPRAGSVSFINLAEDEAVMYVDCDGTPARMVKVIWGQFIGWTYLDAVKSAP